MFFFAQAHCPRVSSPLETWKFSATLRSMSYVQYVRVRAYAYAHALVLFGVDEFITLLSP